NHSAWRLRPAEPADGPPGPSSDSGRWYTTLPSATVDASLDAAARSYSTVLVKKPTDSGYQSRLCLPDDAAITQTCWPHRRLGPVLSTRELRRLDRIPVHAPARSCHPCRRHARGGHRRGRRPTQGAQLPSGPGGGHTSASGGC